MLVVSPLKALMTDQSYWLDSIGVSVAQVTSDKKEETVRGKILKGLAI